MSKRSRADLPHAIDMLWSHQIRRENTLLQKQIQQLQVRLDEVQCQHRDLPSQIDRLEATVAASCTNIESLSSRLRETEDKSEQILRLSTSTTKDLRKLSDDVTSIRDQQSTDVDELSKRIDGVDGKLAQLQEEGPKRNAKWAEELNEVSVAHQSDQQKALLNTLAERVTKLEAKIGRCRCAEEHRSAASNEDNRENPGASGHPDTCVNTSANNIDAHAHVQSNEEYMLTLQNVEDLYEDASPEPRTIDLVENVTTPTFAGQLRPPSHARDSLQPINPSSPQTDTALPDLDLKQGRYHSWERYLAEAQILVDKIPKEDKSIFLQEFVDGLYAAGDRQKCRQWLDHSGWVWESVVSYGFSGTPSVSLHEVAKDTGQKFASKNSVRTTATQHDCQSKQAKVVKQRHAVRHGTVTAEANNPREPRKSQRLAGNAPENSGLDPPAQRVRRPRSTSPEVIAPNKKITTCYRRPVQPATEGVGLRQPVRKQKSGAGGNSDAGRQDANNAIPPSHQPPRATPLAVPSSAASTQSVLDSNRSVPSTPPGRTTGGDRPQLRLTAHKNAPKKSHRRRRDSSSSEDIASFLNQKSRLPIRRGSYVSETESEDPQLSHLPSPPPAPRKALGSRLQTLTEKQPRAIIEQARKRRCGGNSTDLSAPSVKRLKRPRRVPPPVIPILPTSEA